ncbi:Methylated-DNA--protein-cysteine methyltransferase [hydrothermal vent metagenome]|uniref:Methylated-DNA--protein-cysteine methyltransferase n=1 Tax=hydrothermal vent metagenome TaxID=652676 RepID=A0A3B1AET0_9ZZZZ
MPQHSSPETLLRHQLETPIGTMLVIIDRQERLRALDWREYEDRMHRLLQLHAKKEKTAFELKPGHLPVAIHEALDAYFAGDFVPVNDIPVYTAGTLFQQAVWQALRNIPAGTTLSYGALAKKLGRPKAVRAVGAANGANPVGIVIPCHRVIGMDGSMTGYGGGLERKRWLLTHENPS